MGEGLGRSSESYSERPRHHVEKLRSIGGLEDRLNAMAVERGHELDLATSEQSAEWILFQRLMYLLVEESQEWDPLQRTHLRQIVAAFGAAAFPRFTESEQHNFYDNFRSFYEEGEGKIQLDHSQAGLVSRIGQRINIPSDPGETTFTFDISQREQTRRITEIEDPIVTELLINASSEDKIGDILKHIGELILKQKVKLLLTLSDEEYEEFKKRRKAGFANIAEEILSRPDLVPDEIEQIKAISRLRYTTPRYEVETDLRIKWKGKYPSEWDKDLEEDQRFKLDDGLPRQRQGKRISYEEAVEFAKFEHARKFYRNRYFPSVVRLSNPLPISTVTLYEQFNAYKKELDSRKPGTDISMKDLLSAIRYYLGYEPDNIENCEIHHKVQGFVGIIIFAEAMLEKK